jgi:hypothetical protein
MEKKKLDVFRKRLEERQQALRKTVSRTEEDGRIADRIPRRISPTGRQTHTQKSFFFQSAIMRVSF